MTHVLAAVVCGGLGAASGLLVPTLIRGVPPVEVQSGDHDAPDPPSTVDVAAVADRPLLAARAVAYAGLAGVVLGLGLGWAWPLLFLLAAVPLAVALAVIDRHTRVLPSRLVYPAYPLVAVGIVAAWLFAGRPDGVHAPGRAVLGAVIVFAAFHLVWFVVPQGLGYGDVRLSGVLALALAYLGWSELVVGVYAGFLIGGLIGGALSLLRLVERRGYPFGPFLLVGALVGVVLGRPVLSLVVG